MMIRSGYGGFLKDRYSLQVLELAKEYPDRKTLIIDYLDIYKFNNDAGKRLINSPDSELEELLYALRKYNELYCGDPDNNMDGAEVAIRGLIDTVPIHNIGKDHIKKLISIEGRISKIAPKYQKLVEGAFKCLRCGDMTFMPQTDDKLIEPFECENDACGRKGALILIPEKSKYEDRQKIAVQDLYESMKAGQPLREIIVVLKGADLIGSIPAMGAQCMVTGIVRLEQKKESSIFYTHLEASHIEPTETEIDSTISGTDKIEFKELAAKDNILEVLINSTAPEILGYDYIKAAQLCTIVSGSANPKPIRENIHMIVCGDPGTAKTAMSKSPRALVPRAQYSAGRGSSVAGLTVAVVKDELSGSGYMAQAGALVLADRGLMVLDEADKLEKEDFQALNTALEEGFIEIHKGGINQKFNTRFSMIALCNPKNIRFDDYEPFTKQIRIPADTLSRFDLVFKVQDKPDPKRDREIAEHIAKQWIKKTEEDQTDAGRLSQERLSKYLQFAKTFEPEISEDARKAIIEYYLTLRPVNENEAIAATARQLNGLFRLTKSITKLRLSNTCSIVDANKAIWIHKASMEAFIDPTTGKIDIDLISGSSKSQQDRIRQIIEIVKELQGSNGDMAFIDNIVSVGKTKGISIDHVKSDLHHLKNEGDIIEPKQGYYQVISY
jgi:replicative DNA helicase Mcm